ncbi:hypothetical protein CRE_13428 [Caenorhabditis remanei]|uniref:Uncharacterized protein n=1 Tax=Caenorhabditis remanei TaxID=31234 RepID=E3MQY3_CAERE|nr:hypothetical protein CRE_13428 [Caenorhabditis remanei]
MLDKATRAVIERFPDSKDDPEQEKRELNVVYPYVALLIMDEVDGGCTYDYVSECINVNKRQSTEASFTCNTETRNWIYDYTGKEIRSYVQGAYSTAQNICQYFELYSEAQICLKVCAH